MLIFPAIDIKENKCVRLSQGNFDKVKVYSNHPLDIALKWQNIGAKFLHVVDLDGARDEVFLNKKSIESIIKALNIPVQVGGGIRNKQRVRELLDLGVSRVIVGTIAIENQKLLEEIVSAYKERIVVSIDAREGKVAVRGWNVISHIDSMELCKYLEKIGVKTVVYTDITKDGMLEGPNFQIYETLKRNTNLNIIASGGISTISDIKKLKSIGVYGGIIGKAFYDGLLKYWEVEECLQKE